MLLEMKNIDKSFNGVPVLKKVQLEVEKGEVHALLGENGAGKSTLMNVLTGVHPKDGGTIVFDGEPQEHMTIKKSEELGIAFVHQELNLFNDMTVYENIFLGKEIVNKFGHCNKKEMIRVLRTGEGEILLDATGKKNGRGAYICFSRECLEKARKNHGLERSLKVSIPDEVYDSLEKEFDGIDSK